MQESFFKGIPVLSNLPILKKPNKEADNFSYYIIKLKSELLHNFLNHCTMKKVKQ